VTAKFFIVAERDGNITYRPAEETIARNLEFDAPLPDRVLAQADTDEQAQRYVNLLRNRSASQ
jgi:hypothetical protein